MKTVIFALLLVGQCFGLSFFKRSEGRNHEDSYDNIDEPSDYQDIRNCRKGTFSCSRIFLQKYYMPGSDDVLESLRREGLADICTDAMEAYKCIVENSNSQACLATNDDALLRGVGKTRAALEFGCKQKFDEIQSNRDCVFNLDVYNHIEACARSRGLSGPCSTAGLEGCISGAVDAVKECKQEMKSLINDIMLHLTLTTCSALAI